jgi:NAD(P)-dependent dehydrogenase (short-subunit alcohol dehydrogenase family)
MAEALLEAGVKALAIFDANRDIGPSAAAELADRAKIPVDFHFVDVRDVDQTREAVADVMKAHGQIDILVNSAGIAP